MPNLARKFRLPHPQAADALTYARFTGIPTFMCLPHITDPHELGAPSSIAPTTFSPRPTSKR